jgi:hypothetical protein
VTSQVLKKEGSLFVKNKLDALKIEKMKMTILD